MGGLPCRSIHRTSACGRPGSAGAEVGHFKEPPCTKHGGPLRADTDGSGGLLAVLADLAVLQDMAFDLLVLRRLARQWRGQTKGVGLLQRELENRQIDGA